MVNKKETKSNPEAIAKKLKASLHSTRVGLEAFLTSLKRARMKEVIGQYRELSSVLVSQHGWAKTEERTELDPHFAEIAQVASEIQKILSPYAEIFGVLAHLNSESNQNLINEASELRAENASDEGASTSQEQPDIAIPVNDPDAQAVLKALLQHGSLSIQKLSKNVNLEGEKFRKVLAVLTDEGIIEMCGWGRGRTCRFTEEAVSQLLTSALSDLNSTLRNIDTQE